MRHHRPALPRLFVLLLLTWVPAEQSALALSSRLLEKPAATALSRADAGKNSATARQKLVDRFLGQLSPLEEELFAAAGAVRTINLPSSFGRGARGEGNSQGADNISDHRLRLLASDPCLLFPALGSPHPGPLSEGEGGHACYRAHDDRSLLPDHSLLHVTLVASGINSTETLRRYEGKFAALVDELQASGELAGSAGQQAEAIFDFLHCRLLYGGYRIECTDLRMALDHGWFNCVSASVLFNCLAEACGLPVCGLEVPGHAMSRLFLADGVIDLETTCPKWFRLLGDPQKQAPEKGSGTFCRNGPEGAAHKRFLTPVPVREVSAVAMAAMIYYNRGVDLLAAKQFAAAAAANAKALRLDPTNRTAWGNLLATINNWAIALSNAERFAAAAALLRQGMAADRTFETFALNYAHVCHQWTVSLCNAGQFAEALELLARGAAEQPAVAYFRQAPVDVYRRWARTLFDANQPDRALAVFDDAQQQCGVSRELLEAERIELNQWGLQLVEQKRFAAAVAAFDRGLARQPEAALLREGRRTALVRWAETEFGSQHDPATMERSVAAAARGANPAGNSPSSSSLCSLAAQKPGPSPDYFQWLLKLQAAGQRRGTTRANSP